MEKLVVWCPESVDHFKAYAKRLASEKSSLPAETKPEASSFSLQSPLPRASMASPLGLEWRLILILLTGTTFHASALLRMSHFVQLG